MADALTIVPERTRRDRREFFELPYRLYRGHPVWVPPLRMSDALVMNRRKNPFFEHADVQHFLARRGGRTVGRIAAIENRRHNEVHGDRLGFFGWFDAESDPEAASGLVAAAKGWVEGRGLVGMRGPVNYSTNDVCGVLIEGFQHRPAILMPYNREDYDALLLGAGLVKAKDLVAYYMPADRVMPERMLRVASRALERGGFSVRQIDPKRWAAEVDLLLDLYNRSWERNWGFVPMTEHEFRHAAKDLKMLLDPRIFLIMERAGQAVGFVGVLPDVNEAIVDLDGRLFPFGLFRLLARRKRIRSSRILLLGVVPEARGKGVDAALMTIVFSNAGKAGYVGGEASWILEDNVRMRADMEAIGSTLTKRYRIYETPPA